MHNLTKDTERQFNDNGADIKALMAEIKAVGRDVEEIKTAVAGNTKLGIQGIVKRLDANESDVASLKKWRDNINLKVAYTAGIFSALTFGGLEGLKALIETIKHHTP